MGRLANWDVLLFDRVAAARLPGADRVLPRLGRAANHGGLWFGVAAGLALTRSATARRAALRGAGSLALASAGANLLAKPLWGRRRPLADTVPLGRRLLRQPVTTSFPSGHSASAAAFATGVALESPLLGALVAPVAAGVAASRVYTGAHYPGDVLAGVALGTGAALLTRRWWPGAADRPASAAPPGVEAPALPGGQGLVVVVNAGSGVGTGRAPAAEVIRGLLPKADVRVCEDPERLAGELGRAVADVAAFGGALGVAGGDGTVNAAASLAAEHGLPLAVFPAGTLNHFGADVGLDSARDTAEAVELGRAGSVDLGRVVREDGTPAYFLNTFSVGVYPELVRFRETLEAGIGKWPALAVGLVKVMARSQPVRITVNGRRRRVWLLFAGNGHYDPPGFAPARRPALDGGRLDVRMVDGARPFARTRLLAAFLTGTLARSRVYRQRAVTRLQLGVPPGAPGLRCARDGEVGDGPHRTLSLDSAHAALTVYLPAAPLLEHAADAGDIAEGLGTDPGREAGRAAGPDGV
jgi:undecaprenyl-diphosphatase